MILSVPVKSFDEQIATRFEAVERVRDDMHDYQTADVAFFKRTPFAFGLLEMGMGKSVTAGTYATDYLLDRWESEEKVLIVGPIAVVTQSWPDEFRTWKHLACWPFTVLREDDTDPATADRLRLARKEKREGAERVAIRHDLARSRTRIHMISFEGIEWLVDVWKRKWPYKLVIVDESSMLKSHASKRFDALAMVRREDLIDRMVLLTATPAAEGYIGLWSQTYLLDLGDAFGKDMKRYTDEFFSQNRYTFKWTLRPNAEPEILKRIAPMATIRKRADHFNVTEPTMIYRRIVMSDAEMVLYKAMEKESVLRLGDTTIEADTAAALCQKLSQMASGVLYETRLSEPEGYDPDLYDEAPDLIEERIVHSIHDRKIEMLREIVDELGTNLLVSYQHRSSLDRLKKAFPKAVQWDKTGKSKAPWNAGKIQMLLMHPKSGGHGQNLQKGGHVVVFFDIPWSREQFVQLIGRLDRQGQQHPVSVILMVAANTVDERIAKAQEQKRDMEEALFDMLRRLIRGAGLQGREEVGHRPSCP